MTEYISCDSKCKFNSATCNLKQKCKNYYKCKESLNTITCICKNSKYLKSIVNTSMTECDEIVM